MGTIVMDLETQVSKIFDYVTNTALNAALNADLPLVGNLLGTLVPNGVSFLDTIETQLFANLDQLGAAATPAALAAAIDSLTGVEASANGAIISIHVGVADSMNLAKSAFALGIGSEALGFSVMGEANIALNYAVNLLLSYDTNTHKLTTGVGSKEVELTLTGGLDVVGNGQLGFLGVAITDNLVDPAKPELLIKFGLDITDGKDVATLGLADVITTADGTADLDLHLKTVLPSKLLPTLSTDLVAHYDIVHYDPVGGVSAAGSTPSLALNNITLNLGSFVDFLAGVFGPIINTVFGSFPIAPVIDVLTTPIPIIDPALRALGLTSMFDAIGEDGVINLLDIAAQFGGDPEVLNAFATAFNLIKGFQAATSNGGSNALNIDLGSITLLGDAPTAPNAKVIQNNAAVGDPTFHAPSTNPFNQAMQGVQNTLPGTTPKTDGLGGVLSPLADALQGAGISIPLLSHPENILPLLLKGVGGGDAVTLIEYDVPALTFLARYENFFPIIGPIGIGIGGQLSAGVDVNFGYDTHGIADGNFESGFYFNTPALAPGEEKIIDGHKFFFTPVATVGVELDASAQVNVGFAKLAIGGGVAADLSAYFQNAELNPADSGEAGKLRLVDIDECLLSPIAGQVKALLFIDLSIDFIFFSFMHRFDLADVTLAEFSFGCESPTTNEGHGLAILSGAGVDSQGNISQMLRLNGGVFADQLVINGQQQKDTSEAFEVRNGRDQYGQLIPGALEVTSHTIHETYDGAIVPITEIVAQMGDARDVVVIAEDVTTGATIYGGDGDDLLVGGAGNDHLYGEDGFNHLIGGAGNDVLVGGDDDDTIEGGIGADIIDGGDGIDQATYEHSKSGVTFKPSANNSDVFIGSGGEAQGDQLTSIEYLIGSHFNDVLYGNPDESSTIEGLDGNDILIGGSSEDYLIGGAGADALIGGGGTKGDGTSYLTSAGGVVVNLTTGKGSGGDAEGDTYNGIEHVQGSSSDDVITGNFEDNIIDGWYGDDQLSGGSGGDDEIHGGAGNDIIFSTWDGGDKLDGGEGHDTLSYERSTQGVDANLYGNDDTDEAYNNEGDDEIARVLVSSVKVAGSDPAEYTNTYAAHISTFEDLTGSKFNDSLIGDDQYNVITGLAGNDHIEGKGGNDILIGGAGADYLDGGSGIDLADYRGSSAGVFVSLISGNGLNGDANGDNLVSIENLLGSDHSDTLAGDNNDNEIDPGLTGSTVSDIVSGGGGTDTLKLDYSRGGNTKGLIGGYTAGSLTDGSFSRAENTGGTQRDGVQFVLIERLNIVGTAHDDVVYAGLGNDFITTGSGDDLIFTGLGVDRVFAGKGNDIVVSGTDLNRQFSALGGIAPTELDGGAGIDGLAISLAASAENITLIGTSGAAEFKGVNLTLANGTGISNFEVLLNVITGSGNDVVAQTGNFDNFFATGDGNDEIRAGLGQDFVDGGGDFVIGRNITQPDANGVFAPIKSIDSLYANNGDRLVVDYSSVTTAVSSGVTGAITAFAVNDGNSTQAIITNVGFYTGGGNTTEFTDIERVDVTGGSGDDVLYGTDLFLGRNIVSNGAIVASHSLRGDDRLVGGDGNDILIGNTGDDTLIGGAGNDLLLGSAIGSERGPVADLGEVDTLTGGDGADIFVLGTILGGSNRPIVYYNDGMDSALGVPTPADRHSSDSNRAIITDFQADDHLLMAGIASDYRSVEMGGSTFIYLRDGLDSNGNIDASNDELIAELQGVSGFRLDSAAVIFQGDSALANLSGPSIAAPASVNETPAAARFVPAPSDLGARAISAIAALAENAAAAPHIIKAPPSLLAPLPALAAPLALALPAKAATSWVTQTDDTNELRAALFGTTSLLSNGKLTVQGDGSAFGTFDNDPFGLGHGIVLSTGAVEDLAGANMIDGGKTIGSSLELHFVKIGRVGNNDIFRADLTNIGFDINSITLGDASSGFGGGGGIASGFDISAVTLSHTRLDMVGPGTDLNSAATLDQIDAFSFDAANAHFSPGSQRGPDANFGNGADLLGSINGLPIYQFATLDTFDDGFLTLGDGGSLGLNLKQTVSTKAPLYLYVAENGATGEVLTTGFKASSSRLDTPADLSTDLGAPGVAGDSISLTYTFTPSTPTGLIDKSITQVTFDFVFFSEELVEYAQTEFNDNFKITLNGVNLALLSDGSSASINTLYAPNASGSASSSIFTLRQDTIQSDFIYNPVGTGPTASQTRADGYSKILHFTGNIIPGAENVLRFEVNDVRDGLLDSGILIAGGSFTGHSVSEVFIDPVARPIGEGEHRAINFGVKVPVGGHLDTPYSVTFHPTAALDLGAGAGQDVTRTIGRDGQLTDTLIVTPLSDGANLGSRYETIGVEVRGDGPLPALAPLVIEVEDRLVAIARSIGSAPARFNRAQPDAWHDAWTANGIHITHTADASGRTPLYSAVNFGTANPKLLSGSDILNGDLGVSGQARGDAGGIQDIAGKEALRFEFDTHSVSDVTLDFARFERGDVARIELRDAADNIVDTRTSSTAHITVTGLHDVASVTISAMSGAFMVHNLSVTEHVDALLGPGLGGHVVELDPRVFAANDTGMLTHMLGGGAHDSSMMLQMAFV